VADTEVLCRLNRIAHGRIREEAAGGAVGSARALDDPWLAAEYCAVYTRLHAPGAPTLTSMPRHLHVVACGEPLPSPVGIVLAEGHSTMRDSLRALCEGQREFVIVAEAGELFSALRETERHHAGVLVIDIRLLGAQPVQMLARLYTRYRALSVIVLCSEAVPVLAERLMLDGASGFILKEHADVELPDALSAVTRHQPYVSPRLGSRLASLVAGLAT
jgi:CheY-like chemotaxis protein